jgi:hypothetical protein
MRVVRNEKVIGNFNISGPTFGGGPSASDIHISDKCNVNNNNGNLSTCYNCNNLYHANQQTYTTFTGATKGYQFKIADY